MFNDPVKTHSRRGRRHPGHILFAKRDVLVDGSRIALDMGALMAEMPVQERLDNMRANGSWEAYDMQLVSLWWYYIGIPVLKLDPRTGEKADYINGQKVEK